MFWQVHLQDMASQRIFYIHCPKADAGTHAALL